MQNGITSQLPQLGNDAPVLGNDLSVRGNCWGFFRGRGAYPILSNDAPIAASNALEYL